MDTFRPCKPLKLNQPEQVCLNPTKFVPVMVDPPQQTEEDRIWDIYCVYILLVKLCEVLRFKKYNKDNSNFISQLQFLETQ